MDTDDFTIAYSNGAADSDDAEFFDTADDMQPSPATIRAQRNDTRFGVMVGLVLLAFLGLQFMLNDKAVKHPVATATPTASGYANIFSAPSNRSAFSTSPDNNALTVPPLVTPLPQAPVQPAPTATAIPAETSQPTRRQQPAPTATTLPPTAQPTPTDGTVPTATPAPTVTPVPTLAPTATPVPTALPTAPPSPTPNLTPTATPQPSVTATTGVTQTTTVVPTATATTLP